MTNHTPETRWCWDAKLDRKVFQNFGAMPGMGLTDRTHGGPYRTEEAARQAAPLLARS